MNSKFFGVLVAVSLFSCGAGPQGEIAGEEQGESADALSANALSAWFPTNVGNSWTFEKLGTAGTRTVKIEKSANGSTLSGLFPGAPMELVSGSASSTTLSVREATNAVSRLVRFNSKASWTIGNGPCGTFVVSEKKEVDPVTTLAGDFQNVRTFVFTAKTDPLTYCQFAPGVIRELTFAAKVGLVAFSTYENEMFYLSSSNVAGALSPAASSVVGTLTLNKGAFANKPNSIRCIQAPCPSNAELDIAKLTYTVKNNSKSAVSFNFSNTCRFNVKVVDSTGLVIRNDETVRLCGQAFGTLTLQPGQSESYTQELPMEDLSGSQMEGAYTVFAYLTPGQGAAAVSSKRFAVGTR